MAREQATKYTSCCLTLYSDPCIQYRWLDGQFYHWSCTFTCTCIINIMIIYSCLGLHGKKKPLRLHRMSNDILLLVDDYPS